MTPVTISAVAEPATARVSVTASGGVPGATLYLFRRDTAGVGVVRDTSAGTVVWPAAGAVTARNHVFNAELLDTTGDGSVDGLVLTSDMAALPTTEHALPGGSGRSVRLTWPDPARAAYPSSTLYPSGNVYPQGA